MSAEELWSISVVVPVFNEIGSVSELIQRIDTTLSDLAQSYEIVFVDDGSTDNTLQNLLDLQQKNPQLVVVELSRNHGQTAALAAGIEQAQYPIIVTMDGDLQHAPEEIATLLARLSEGFDVVSGCRAHRTDTVIKRIPSRIANAIVRWRSGIPIRDFASTFKVYRASIVKQLDLFGELHRFIPVLAYRIGARMTEVPITIAERASGESKYGLSRTFGVFLDIIFLEFYLNYLSRPLRAFGKLFFLLFGLGFGISVFLMGLWAFGLIEGVIQHAALLLFSILLMILGIQFLVGGILAEILSRIYFRSGGTAGYTIRTIHRATPQSISHAARHGES